jgi:hypothetical protein
VKAPAGFKSITELKTLSLEAEDVAKQTQDVRDRFSAVFGG